MSTLSCHVPAPLLPLISLCPWRRSAPDEENSPQIRRDLLILPNNDLGQKIISGLKVKSELKLHSKEIKVVNASIFEQGDVSFSRKKIIPIIEEILYS